MTSPPDDVTSGGRAPTSKRRRLTDDPTPRSCADAARGCRGYFRVVAGARATPPSVERPRIPVPSIGRRRDRPTWTTTGDRGRRRGRSAESPRSVSTTRASTTHETATSASHRNARRTIGPGARRERAIAQTELQPPAGRPSASRGGCVRSADGGPEQ